MCPFSKITKSCERPLSSLGGHLRLRQKSPLISISDYSEGLIIYFTKKELYNGTLTIIVFYTDTIAGEDTWGLGRQVMLGLELAGTQTRFFG